MNIFDKSDDKFAPAQDWFYDRYLARQTEAKRYMVLCVSFGLLLAISLIGFIILLPLKSTIMEPYVVLVDNSTGITATLTAAKSSDLSEHTIVTRYFISKYVQAREGYNALTTEKQIDLVQAFSSPEAFVTFQGEWGDIKRQEEREVLGLQGELSVEVLSVTFPLPDVAHVRYLLSERRAGNSVGKSMWLATLKLTQVAEVDNQLAMLNPLGLVITNYETIKEANHALSDQTQHNTINNI